MARPLLRTVRQCGVARRPMSALPRAALRSTTAAATVIALSLLAALDAPGIARAAETVALEQTTAPSTCDRPQHHQLDFWVGDWQVFDGETNQLVALDRVEKHSEGCIIQEN